MCINYIVSYLNLCRYVYIEFGLNYPLSEWFCYFWASIFSIGEEQKRVWEKRSAFFLSTPL